MITFSAIAVPGKNSSSRSKAGVQSDVPVGPASDSFVEKSRPRKKRKDSKNSGISTFLPQDVKAKKQRRFRKRMSILLTVAALLSGGASALNQLVIRPSEQTSIYEQRSRPVPRLSDLIAEGRVTSKAEEVYFTTKDGLQLKGWYVPPTGDNPTVLYAHGRSGNIANEENIRYMNGYVDRGFGFLVFDYRGYGDNPGEAHEEGVYLDTQAASELLTKVLGIPPSNLVIMGYSLGGAIAIHEALRLQEAGTPASALVLLSTFTRMRDMTRRENEINYTKHREELIKACATSPWLEERLFFLDELHTLMVHPVLGPLVSAMINNEKFPSIDRIAKLKLPIQIWHGSADPFIPYEMGAANEVAAVNSLYKEFRLLPGADHSSVRERSEEIVGGAVSFARTYANLSRKNPPPLLIHAAPITRIGVAQPLPEEVREPQQPQSESAIKKRPLILYDCEGLG